MLFERFSNQEDVKQYVLPLNKFKPFPTIEERVKWENLDEALKLQIISKGEEFLTYSWPVVSAASIMNYVRTGDRLCNEDIHFTRRLALGSLVLAECVEAQGRFLDQIINGFWAICEESMWSVSAHKGWVLLPNVIDEIIIDLFAAETGGTLAMLLYLIESKLNEVAPVISQRVKYELKHRVCTPYIESNDYSWMGFSGGDINNWNPWCNSNCLATCLYVLEDVSQRSRAIDKSMRSLEAFYNIYEDDGGCDEGPRYWERAAASLFDCLDLMSQVTGGYINLFSNKRIKNMGRFIAKTRLTEQHYINFSDSSIKVFPDASIVYRYGKAVGDEQMMSEAAHLLNESKIIKYDPFYSAIRVLPAIFSYSELSQYQNKVVAERNVCFSDIEVLISRQHGEANKGLVIAAKGGHNQESHNHNDVGSFVVYKDGQPVLIDVGVGVYTAKTFSAQRYEIWTMRSDYHNLPIINGVVQEAGRTYETTDVKYQADKDKTFLSMNITKAYPKSANVKSWQREFLIDQDKIRLTDDYELISMNGDTSFVFMSLIEPKQEKNWIIIGDAKVKFDVEKLNFTYEIIDVNDRILHENLGDRVFRIVLRVKDCLHKGQFEFIIE